ncbi:uncharacterized protein LOC123699447 [Colias croceus]|uniref:uncharacterized protein LOC123699447 n=1 Tax=Colias crocea TaxID=72248 RepID=UPI001E27F5C1|nr:uncharacterized protein LOC123699447 [Colias croceus]
MRRGHQGIGGWRNETPRHYRPRNGGNPHFRPSRNFPLLSSPRFPPPGPRSHRPNFHRHESNDHDRSRYRSDLSHYSFTRSSDKQHHNERQILPLLQPNMKHGSNVSTNSYHGTSNPDRYHVNSMGDIDHRQIQHKRDFKSHPIPPWNVDNQFQDIDDRAYNRTYKNDSMEQNKTQPEYVGHRPPSSDHYGGNPISSIENSNTFSRSVDDTVNIVRKRLLSKNDSQHTPESRNQEENVVDNSNIMESASSHHEQPVKKKLPRQRQNIKVNCDKIKNKIFHQLFKMDKEKIHKLLDNPNSSTKFEYAINSLLTESQNSFNQHLRSVAEKSLCSSSTEFMENDNNTIYEDTFMKQMQCILDPQDTVLLEDIKPVVMAELSKVLQLDEFEHRFDTNEKNNFPSLYQGDETDYCHEYQDAYNPRELPQSNTNDSTNNTENYNYNFVDQADNYYRPYEDQRTGQQSDDEPQPLFERRPRRKSCNFSRDRNNTTEKRNMRKSVDSRLTDYFPREEKFIPKEEAPPLFDANVELGDVEDTFAELDKQYHVAVDHDFIENDDLCNPVPDFNKNPYSELNIKQEKNNIHDLQLLSQDSFNNRNNFQNDQSQFNPDTTNPLEDTTYQHSCQMKGMEVKNNNNDSENSNIITTPKTSASSNSRKRSIEQKPSHRKEKRKKMEENCDTSHKTNNKNEILHDHDFINKEKIQSSKSTSSVISKKNDKAPPSEERRKSSSEKNYSDKYVKRKESEVKQNNSRKRQTSTSSNHSISPKNNDTSKNLHTPSKTETKITLKTIDIFTEQPKKVNLHQAYRNTAQQSNTKKIAEIKPKPTYLLHQKSSKKHDVTTQVIKRLLTKETQTSDSKCSTSRFCQTVKTKCATKGIQTDVELPNKSNKGSKSTDTFERMKEIDLEIQVLLQEKFKLYNSLESKEGAVPMQSLGMTVLNVGTLDDNKGSNDDFEDDIVNNFTSIPEEELEQIAFETAQENQNQSFMSTRRNQRRKELQNRPDSESPHGYTKDKKKSKSPNISLIEQIITDDRPLEDIISLDDLEVTPAKSKPKPRQRPKKKAAPKRKRKTSPETVELKECYVLLIREDFSKYSICNKVEEIVSDLVGIEDIKREFEDDVNYIADTRAGVSAGRVVPSEETIIEETIVNDLQFDMLDVSEDIVIGDHCEVKCTDEKEAIDHPDVPISEEIILDNSQSSMEDVTTPAESQGGECKLYDYSSDENLQRDSLIVSGNADAILAIECVEQNFLAAGLDGNVYYFNGDGQLITTLRGSNLAVTCLTIVKEKYGTTVYTGSLDSRIRYYDLETGLEKGPECNVLSPIQTMDRAWDTVFVGTRTGFVLQFECKNNMLIPVSTVKFSDQSILALRAMKEGPRKVLLVAARSENVTIRDAQTGLLLRTLCGPKMTVYTLLYEDGKVYCGTSSHQIQVFDYTSGAHVGTHEGGKGAVCLRATGGLVFAGCYDGCVYVYREGEPRPLAQLRGPSLMLLSLAVQGSKIIAGFKDRSLYIWKIPLCILQEMIL